MEYLERGEPNVALLEDTTSIIGGYLRSLAGRWVDMDFSHFGSMGLIEMEKEYRLQIPAPGFRRNDVRVYLQRGYVCIRGYRDTGCKERQLTENYFLPQPVSPKIDWDIKDGLIDIKIRKAAPKVDCCGGKCDCGIQDAELVD